MTDNGDHNRDGWSPGRSDRDDVRRGQEGPADGRADGGGLTREEWESLAADPNWEENLGYRLCEWEEFSTLDDSDALMFLPADEAVLREDAFVVAAEDAVVDLGRWY